MLTAARDNLWKAQERLGVKPKLNVEVNDFLFCMDKPYRRPIIRSYPFLKCTIRPDLLERILKRELHWNNVELACDIMFDRIPNHYMPDVHTLMSFFHV